MMPPPMRTPLLQLPEYHEDMLLVKMRPSAAPFATVAFQNPATILAASPGLSVLTVYERAGLIKRVTPLNRPSGASVAAHSPLTVLATAALPPAGGEPKITSGACIVELQKGTDRQQLQMALANDFNVEFVSRVPVRYLLARARHAEHPAPAAAGGATIAAAPPAANTMWNLLKIKWREARTGGLNTAAQISVAVLDTGVDLSHPDLPGAQITYIHDYPESGASAPEQDAVGHGTHVSGTIRAIIDNGIGVNGICDCKLSVYKIFDDQIFDTGQGYFAYGVNPILYRAALAASVDAGVQVVNLSIGGYGPPDPQESSLFQALINNNTAVVAAMGNDNTAKLSYPAAIPGVIAVGATSLDDTRADFSNFGNHIALSAPGVKIWSTLPTYPGQSGFYYAAPGNPTPGQPIARDTNYDAWDGTSMATPHVTAAAALILQKKGAMSPADLKKQLMQAADKVHDMNGQDFTPDFGAGRLNLLNLAS